MDIRRIKIIIFVIALFLIPSFSNIYGATLSKPANNLGLVGYWSFDEGTSTQATDFSGRGNTGTLTNMSAPASATSGWGNGKLGGGLNFDGSNDYVDMGDPANGSLDFDINSPATFSFWINRVSASETANPIVKRTSGGSGYSIDITTAGVVSFTIGDNFSTNSRIGRETSTTLNLNQWYHVVVVYSGSGSSSGIDVYFDGIAQTMTNPIDNYTGVSTLTSTSFALGSRGSGIERRLNGKLDEVRVYNRLLSAGEVVKLYNVGTSRINSSQNNLIRNGLIGYWNMDSSYSRNSLVTDLSSSGNTLGVLGTPQKSIGKVGQSFNMDASDDELFCTDANCGGTTGGKYDMGTRDFTVMAWIYPESGGTNCNVSGRIASKIGDDEAQGWFIGIGNGFICASVRDSGVDISSTVDGSQVILNEWNHVAVVFDRDGNITRYLNGVQTGTQDSIASYNGISLDHPHNFCIGARDGGAGCLERMFDGRIDEVRVYERTLNAGEINTLYRSGESKINASQNVISGSTLNNGLIGMWSFNSKDLSDRVYDRSGNSNDGYLYNVATGSAKTIGKIGQALKFDGVNDAVTIGDVNAIDGISKMTVSAWVYQDSLVQGNSVVSKYSSAEEGWGILVSDQTAGGDDIMIRLSFSIIANIETIHNAREWEHWTFVFDGTQTGDANRLKFYKNGSPVTITSFGGTIPSTIPNTSSSLCISGIETNIGEGCTNNRFWNGKIDEVRIYNRDLTASEVKQLYILGR